MPITDYELVSQAQQGDKDAYGALFTKYQDKIYNFTFAMVGNREDAKDITQKAFIKVYEALARLEAGSLNFSAYLYRTARNAAFDLIKDKQRYAGPEALETVDEPNFYANPQKAALLKEEQHQVRRAAAGLSAEQRAVFTLRELQELSYEDIAAVMDMPKNTVGVQLARARLNFKREFRMSQVDVEKLSQECRKMLPLLAAYIDNELTERQKDKVNKHLDDCPLCRLALEDMGEASKRYRGLIPLLPPPTLKAEAMENIGRLSHLQTAREPTTKISVPEAEAAGQGRKPALSFGKQLLLVAGAAVIFFSLGFSAGYYGADIYFSLPPIKQAAVKKPIIKKNKSVDKTPPRSGKIVDETSPAVETPSPVVDNKPAPAPVPTPQLTPQSETADTTASQPAVDTTPPPTPRLISPNDGALIQDPQVSLQWSAVSDSSGVKYVLEIQTQDSQGVWQPLLLKEGLTATSYSHTLGQYRERWRVWAVDGAGNAGPKTGWWQVGLY